MARRTCAECAVSPNQEFRRSEIIEAAADLLRTRGVASCPERGSAKRAGVSKGVVHCSSPTRRSSRSTWWRGPTSSIREQASVIADPEQALWRAIVAYLMWYAHSSMTLVWCEYHVASMRAGRFDGVVAIQAGMLDLFAGALARVSPGAERHAPAITRHLTGAVLSQPQMPVDPAELVAEPARLIDLAPPAMVAAPCPCRFHGPPVALGMGSA